MAGVACVTTAVVTTPVDRPLISASSAIESTLVFLLYLQSFNEAFSSDEMVPKKGLDII